MPEIRPPIEPQQRPDPGSGPKQPLSGKVVQGTLHLLLAESALPVAALPGALPGLASPAADPYDWSCGFTQVLVEVLSGYRLPSQLARHTTTSIFADIRHRAMPPPRPGSRQARRRPRVHRVHLCSPHERAAEVAAVVAEGQRMWALALRMEHRHDRWLVTALETG